MCRVPDSAMTPWWAQAGDSRIICFGNCAALSTRTKTSVSFECVVYAKQTVSDGGWKVRKRQRQQVGVGLAPPQTTQHNNVPCAVGET